jgi:hypothetical protein
LPLFAEGCSNLAQSFDPVRKTGWMAKCQSSLFAFVASFPRVTLALNEVFRVRALCHDNGAGEVSVRFGNCCPWLSPGGTFIPQCRVDVHVKAERG